MSHLKYQYKTYKSNPAIEGGSATNSNSLGGSLGTNGCSVAACLSSSCCFCWVAVASVGCLGTGGGASLTVLEKKSVVSIEQYVG